MEIADKANDKAAAKHCLCADRHLQMPVRRKCSTVPSSDTSLPPCRATKVCWIVWYWVSKPRIIHLPSSVKNSWEPWGLTPVYWIVLMFVLCCTVLYCTVLYCIVLYCIVLYCIVLYYTVLYYIVLYCIILYCTVWYCIVLYFCFIHTLYVHPLFTPSTLQCFTFVSLSLNEAASLPAPSSSNTHVHLCKKPLWIP